MSEEIDVRQIDAAKQSSSRLKPWRSVGRDCEPDLSPGINWSIAEYAKADHIISDKYTQTRTRFINNSCLVLQSTLLRPFDHVSCEVNESVRIAVEEGVAVAAPLDPHLVSGLQGSDQSQSPGVAIVCITGLLGKEKHR